MINSIDLDSGVPVFAQIENSFLFAIASGRMKAGDRLPTVRDYAEQIGVNPNTIAKAYRDLEVMGLVNPRRGMGVFVNKGIEARCKEECRKKIIARLHEALGEAKAAGMAPEEINEVIRQSIAIEGPPYGPTPLALLQLAKAKRPIK